MNLSWWRAGVKSQICQHNSAKGWKLDCAISYLGCPWLQRLVHATCSLNLTAVYCDNRDKVSLFPELDFTQARTYGLIGHSLSDFTWILSPLIDGGRRRRHFQSHRSSSSVSCSKKWDRNREGRAILYLCFPRNWRWRRSNFPGENHSVLFGIWIGHLCKHKITFLLHWNY